MKIFSRSEFEHLEWGFIIQIEKSRVHEKARCLHLERKEEGSKHWFMTYAQVIFAQRARCLRNTIIDLISYSNGKCVIQEWKILKKS
jgi:hypothetical protein